MNPTEKEIIEVMDEYREAMLESVYANQGVEKAQLRKQKAFKRLTLARDAARAIRFV